MWSGDASWGYDSEFELDSQIRNIQPPSSQFLQPHLFTRSLRSVESRHLDAAVAMCQCHIIPDIIVIMLLHRQRYQDKKIKENICRFMNCLLLVHN